jgi:hypothetical protein
VSTASFGAETPIQFFGIGRATIVAMHDCMGDRPPEKRSGHDVARVMGVLFYPSVTHQPSPAVAESLDPPNWVVFCDGRRDGECLGGMAGGKRLIVAEGLELKCVGSRKHRASIAPQKFHVIEGPQMSGPNS